MTVCVVLGDAELKTVFSAYLFFLGNNYRNQARNLHIGNNILRNQQEDKFTVHFPHVNEA